MFNKHISVFCHRWLVWFHRTLLSGAASNNQLTETDRQSPRLDSMGAVQRKLSQEDKVFYFLLEADDGIS